MVTTVIVVLLVALVGGAFLSRRATEPLRPAVPPSGDAPDNLAEPIISYSLYILDTRLNRRLEMQSPKEYPHQYGLLQGQSAELHWNVLNADWITIEGAGHVQAIGKKELFPTQHTQYKIIARNRHHKAEQAFVIRVFPVPVMEKLHVPMPDISRHTIELFKTSVPEIPVPPFTAFPSLQVPGVIALHKELVAEHPKVEAVDYAKIARFARNDREEARTFKGKIFDRLERFFADNYKIRDILQTIRKHYG